MQEDGLFSITVLKTSYDIIKENKADSLTKIEKKVETVTFICKNLVMAGGGR